jgi:NAD(P)-dependent dehydrogenase (short-subunit alcohol dehydrogenase family)|tara:strand:+ start:584 stop:1246 length:663 start_codon:yes stop_codon:yes gene_type:complete
VHCDATELTPDSLLLHYCQTNHLSQFLLASEAMALLETAAAKRGEARIVLHSSLARSGAPLEAKYFAPGSGGALGGNGNSMLFNGARWLRYHQSKLANIIFAQSLHVRLAAKGSLVKALCAAPGYCATPLQVKAVASGGMAKSAIWTTKMAQSIPDGTVPLLTCCFSEGVASGEFYEPSEKMNCVGPVKQVPVPLKERDPASMAMLWQASEAAIGAKWEL